MSVFPATTRPPAGETPRGPAAAFLRPPVGTSFPADEWRLIQEAAEEAAWDRLLPMRSAAADTLRRIARHRGVDRATAAAYAWLLAAPSHGPGIEAFFAAAAAGPSPEAIRAAAGSLTVLVVPGAFYEEYPQTGAGGESLIGELDALGIRVRRIPTRSAGTLEQNTAIVRRALREHAGGECLVVSLSRGGAEIKCVLRDDPDALRAVSLWLSVGGILAGSPLVNWVRERRIVDWLNRLVFLCRGRDYRCFTQLARGAAGSLAFDPGIPGHLEVIHVIGFPLRRHVTSPYARSWHARFAAQGPNDGVMLLEDALGFPGTIVPLWAADHYASDRWDFRLLVAGILRRWHQRSRRDIPPGMDET
jgi:hypothetical protein